jgi:HK97 family phage prohead protease
MREYLHSDGKTVCREYSHGEAPLEYSGGGSITALYGRTGDSKSIPTAFPSIGRIGGYATRWNKPHYFKGVMDVFLPGAFTTSLAAKNRVHFCEEHDETKIFATTNGGGLELRSDETGLAFIADPSVNTDCQRAVRLVASNIKRAMSVKYTVLDHFYKTIAGEQVRFIRSANLQDIALCQNGAVKEAYAEIVQTKSSEPTHKTVMGADLHAAHAKLMQAHQAVVDALVGR